MVFTHQICTDLSRSIHPCLTKINAPIGSQEVIYHILESQLLITLFMVLANQQLWIKYYPAGMRVNNLLKSTAGVVLRIGSKTENRSSQKFPIGLLVYFLMSHLCPFAVPQYFTVLGFWRLYHRTIGKPKTTHRLCPENQNSLESMSI